MSAFTSLFADLLSTMACPIYFTCIFLILALFHQVTVQGTRGENSWIKSLGFYRKSIICFTVLTFTAGAGQDLIFEDGYKVFTVIDGDKSNIKVNPYSIIHQSPPSDLFILLDSVASTFYTVSLPTTSNGVYLDFNLKFYFIITALGFPS